MNHRRLGKIARLPAEVRDQLNQSIYQGLEYSRIADWLTEQGYPGISAANLSNWKSGGYEDWLKHCQRLEELEVKLQYAAEVALQADPGQFQQATINLTCLQFFEMLHRFDPCGLVSSLQTRPEKYPALVNSLARFTREFVGLQRFRTELEDRAVAQAERNAPNLGGLSDDTVTKMLQALRIHYPAQFRNASKGEGATGSDQQPILTNSN